MVLQYSGVVDSIQNGVWCVCVVFWISYRSGWVLLFPPSFHDLTNLSPGNMLNSGNRASNEYIYRFGFFSFQRYADV